MAKPGRKQNQSDERPYWVSPPYEDPISERPADFVIGPGTGFVLDMMDAGEDFSGHTQEEIDTLKADIDRIDAEFNARYAAKKAAENSEA